MTEAVLVHEHHPGPRLQRVEPADQIGGRGGERGALQLERVPSDPVRRRLERVRVAGDRDPGDRRHRAAVDAPIRGEDAIAAQHGHAPRGEPAHQGKRVVVAADRDHLPAKRRDGVGHRQLEGRAELAEVADQEDRLAAGVATEGS